jgi:hypothetical protein
MRPTSDTALQRPDLGMAVYETLTSAPTMGFIGLQVMPPFYVPVNAAEYPVIPKEALFNLLDTSRGPLGHYNRSGDEFESGYFRTTEKGLEARLDDRYRALYSSKFAWELAISNIKMNEILRAQEYAIAAKIINTSNFTPVNAAVSWATLATATPKYDIITGKAALRAKGIIPNKLIVNYTNFLQLTQMTEVKTAVYQIFPDAAKTGTISQAQLEAYLDIPLLIAGAMYNTAGRSATASLSDLWGTRYAMLCRVAEGDTADVIEPCIGRSFVWNEGAQQTVIVEQYRDEAVRSDMLRVRHDVDWAFLASYDSSNSVKSEISKACGYLLDTTAAT